MNKKKMSARDQNNTSTNVIVRQQNIRRKAEFHSKKANQYYEMLRDIQTKAKKDGNMKLIGTCYRYNNSYGSGERWWMYVQIVRVTEEGGELIVDEYQKTTRGIEIKRNASYTSGDTIGLDAGYIPISAEEFRKAKADILKEIGLTTTTMGEKGRRKKAA